MKKKTKTKKVVKKQTAKKKKKVSDAVRWQRIIEGLNYNIKCRFDRLMKIQDLQPHPRNPNEHPDKQIALFADIMKYQGVRRPLVVSSLSGYIVAGHGQLEAMRLNGWEWAPIEIQDYQDESQEYAALVADNALGQQSKMDKSKINHDLGELGPDIVVEMLAIPNFEVVPEDNPPVPHSKSGDMEKLEFNLMIDNANLVRKALHKSSTIAHHDNSLSQDERGSQLVYICKEFMGR